MNPAADDPQFAPVDPQQRAEACRLLLGGGKVEAEQVELLTAAVDADEVARQGLLGAYQAGRLVGAVFSQVQPGRTDRLREVRAHRSRRCL